MAKASSYYRSLYSEFPAGTIDKEFRYRISELKDNGDDCNMMNDPLQGHVAAFAHTENDRKNRVSIWSISEDRAVKFHTFFYLSSTAGISIFACNFVSDTRERGWQWIEFETFINSIPAVAISSAILTLIVIDGGGMLVEIYRDRRERKIRRAREDALRQVFQDISRAEISLPEELREKYQKFLSPIRKGTTS